jgi:hypothetical protein
VVDCRMDGGLSQYLHCMWRMQLCCGEIWTICAKAEGEVKPTTPEALPAPLIEYAKCGG